MHALRPRLVLAALLLAMELHAEAPPPTSPPPARPAADDVVAHIGHSRQLVVVQTPSWDAVLLAELGAAMRDASICGLGQAAPGAFDSVLRYFAHELEASR